jgi:hypothetical protein
MTIHFDSVGGVPVVPQSHMVDVIVLCILQKWPLERCLLSIDFVPKFCYKIRHEGDGFFAFKPKPHRFMAFFVMGKTVIITHCFEKKRDDLPPKEMKLAKSYRRDYKQRVKEGTYYE